MVLPVSVSEVSIPRSCSSGRRVLRDGAGGRAGGRRALGPSWRRAPALSRRAAEARAQAADPECSVEQAAGELAREGSSGRLGHERTWAWEEAIYIVFIPFASHG